VSVQCGVRCAGGGVRTRDVGTVAAGCSQWHVRGALRAQRATWVVVLGLIVTQYRDAAVDAAAFHRFVDD